MTNRNKLVCSLQCLSSSMHTCILILAEVLDFVQACTFKLLAEYIDICGQQS